MLTVSIWLVISLLTQFLHLNSVSSVLALLFILLSLTTSQTSQFPQPSLSYRAALFSASSFLPHLLLQFIQSLLISEFCRSADISLHAKLFPLLFHCPNLTALLLHSSFFSPTLLNPYDHISLPTYQTQSPEFSAFICILRFDWLILRESLIIARGAT